MMHLLLCQPELAPGTHKTSFRSLLAARHRPALVLRDRPMLLDPYDVADRIGVGLVMSLVLLAAPHRLLEQRVGEAALDADDHRLVLLVAHHDALQHPLRHLPLLTSPACGRRVSAARPS